MNLSGLYQNRASLPSLLSTFLRISSAASLTPRLEPAPRGASRGAARVCSWQRSKQQAGAGHPQIFMSFFLILLPNCREDDQANTVLLERNRQAEVLKGL